MDLRRRQQGILRQVDVDFFDAFGDQLIDLWQRREIGVTAVGQTTPLGPVAHCVDVDVDEDIALLAHVAEGHGFLDERKKLQLVFDVLGREHRAAGHAADILGAVDDLQVAVLVEKPGVAGMEIAGRIDRFGGGFRPLEITAHHAV